MNETERDTNINKASTVTLTAIYNFLCKVTNINQRDATFTPNIKQNKIGNDNNNVHVNGDDSVVRRKILHTCAIKKLSQI